MRASLLPIIAVLSIPIGLFAEDDALKIPIPKPIGLKEMMHGRDFTNAGLAKLTIEELRLLDAWIDEFGCRCYEYGKRAVSPSKAPQSQFDPDEFLREFQQYAATPPTESHVSHTIETRINGDFNGWDGDTVLVLDNGQIWRQVDAHIEVRYAYRPKATVFKSGALWKVIVSGCRKPVSVERMQ